MDNSKELEQMIDGLMRDDSLQSPSTDFTNNVVGTIFSRESTVQKMYKPLLPKWSWYLIALGALGFMLFGLQQYTPTENWVGYDQFLNVLGNWSSQFFSSIRVSKIVVYVVVVAGGLACFQTMVLKNYWNNRLS